MAYEYFDEGSDDVVRREVGRIPERLAAIFADAEKTGQPTNLIADELARRLVREAGAANDPDTRQTA